MRDGFRGIIRYALAILGVAMSFATAGNLLAQSAAEPASTAAPVTNAGAYEALSEGNQKIVRAIYEAQLGSPNDTAAGALLSRNDIAAMGRKTGWGNLYHQLQAQGYVSGKNLGQAISSYNQSLKGNGDLTIINTAGGEQLAFRKPTRPDDKGASKLTDEEQLALGKATPPVRKASSAAKSARAKQITAVRSQSENFGVDAGKSSGRIATQASAQPAKTTVVMRTVDTSGAAASSSATGIVHASGSGHGQAGVIKLK